MHITNVPEHIADNVMFRHYAALRGDAEQSAPVYEILKWLNNQIDIADKSKDFKKFRRRILGLADNKRSVTFIMHTVSGEVSIRASRILVKIALDSLQTANASGPIGVKSCH